MVNFHPAKLGLFKRPLPKKSEDLKKKDLYKALAFAEWAPEKSSKNKQEKVSPTRKKTPSRGERTGVELLESKHVCLSMVLVQGKRFIYIPKTSITKNKKNDESKKKKPSSCFVITKNEEEAVFFLPQKGTETKKKEKKTAGNVSLSCSSFLCLLVHPSVLMNFPSSFFHFFFHFFFCRRFPH